MNILVTGNGFDLSLGLKTKYEDYLKFARYFSLSGVASDKEIIPSALQCNIESNMKKFFANNEAIKEMYLSSEGIDDFLQTLNVIKDSPQKSTILKDFYGCIRRNLWFDYFWKLFENNRMQGKNWIDLENEIKNVIERVDGVRANRGTEQYEGCSIENNIINPEKNVVISKKFDDMLWIDFQKFVLAFDIYLSIFVYNPDLVKAANRGNKVIISEQMPNIDHVMTFNYMDNYDILFPDIKPDNVCYLHGQLKYKTSIENGVVQDSSPLVLGFYANEGVSREGKLLRYQKIIQRTHNYLSSKYVSWFNATEKKNIFIVGHSLDMLDKDILLHSVFSDSRMHTMYIQIFYHEEEVKWKLESNLISLIGVEAFQLATYISKNIRFVKQNW